MIEDFIPLINSVGFPVFVSCILLYDKLKTNGSLKKVVENNNNLLKEIKHLCEDGRKQRTTKRRS